MTTATPATPRPVTRAGGSPRRQYRADIVNAALTDPPATPWRTVVAAIRADGPPVDIRTVTRVILATR